LSVTQWETFYRSGTLATGPAGSNGQYDQELLQVWREFFASLRPDSRILEIGAGNAPIALIALEVAAKLQRNFDYVATDVVTTNPQELLASRYPQLSQIRYFPNTAAERLPFEDAHFDAACASYAFEYANAETAAAELARVLRRGAEVQFVMHHLDSILVEHAGRSIDDSKLIFDSGVFTHLAALVGLVEATEAQAKAVADLLQRAIRIVKAVMRERNHAPMLAMALGTTQQILAQVGKTSPTQLRVAAENAERDLHAGVESLQELLARAVSSQQVQSLCSLLREQGFHSVEAMPHFHAKENLVGWLLLATRA
jgi:ubiquinone/menaquinone biosynthesis C-methylase UbiE